MIFAAIFGRKQERQLKHARAARELVAAFIAAGGTRPKCVGCGCQLKPVFDYYTDDLDVPSTIKGWGLEGCGNFHSLTCAWHWAELTVGVRP